MKKTGLENGGLRPCPRSPNCLCSQDPDPGHATEPWPYEGEAAATRERLLSALKSLPRTTIVSSEEHYVHATCRSAVFRFVDDVELLIDDAEKLVHVRSASRLGYSDLGANGRRIRALRAAFEATAD